MNDIKAIIFDCDGVLVDSEIIVIEEKIKGLETIDLKYNINDFRAKYLSTKKMNQKNRMGFTRAL